MSAQTLLEACESAIVALLAGARSVQIGGKSYTKEGLGELKKFRSELLTEIDRESNGYFSVVQVDRPS